MGHMQSQVEFGTWIEVNSGSATEYLPMDFCAEAVTSDFTPLDEDAELPDWVHKLCEGCELIRPSQVTAITVKEGWGARLSAPGYLDCTEWSVYDTEQEALEYLAAWF